MAAPSKLSWHTVRLDANSPESRQTSAQSGARETARRPNALLQVKSTGGSATAHLVEHAHVDAVLEVVHDEALASARRRHEGVSHLTRAVQVTVDHIACRQGRIQSVHTHIHARSHKGARTLKRVAFGVAVASVRIRKQP
eukprot:6187429-Pleurochrysis_carterae.AAC.1